jgi:deazaflavin-dependent oxidoreductase (nitroreductase family)
MTSRNEWNAHNLEVIDQFRSGGGKVTTGSGNALLLLNTIGAKTGLARTNPLAYLPGGDCLYIFASKGGSPAHPDWYLNLVTNPAVAVEVGTERYEATAEPITGPERRRIYARRAYAFNASFNRDAISSGFEGLIITFAPALRRIDTTGPTVGCRTTCTLSMSRM